MTKHLIHSELLNESYYKINHETGLTIYVYPKSGYSSTYAIFGTKYGSINTSFTTLDGKLVNVPDGIAHFLEHKLFECEDGDAFSKFAVTGASANAYTSFDKTCYLFSCTENFEDSLKILLDFVQSPYFTKESVEKEQGIIGQEIKMYEDTPNWRVLFNLLRIMYHNNPIKTDIAGTVESISEITPELLYTCYNNFYNLHNMALVVVGNVDPDTIINIANKSLKPCEPMKVKFEFPHEPKELVKNYIEEKSAVSIPVMQMGYKENIENRCLSDKEIAATDVINSMIFSQASDLYKSLMNDKLINNSFTADRFDGFGYSCILIEAETKYPEILSERIKAEIQKLHSIGLDVNLFESTKKALYGSFVASFNSNDNISNQIISKHFNNKNLFDYADALVNLTFDDINQRFVEVFNNDYFAVSIIKPM